MCLHCAVFVVYLEGTLSPLGLEGYTAYPAAKDSRLGAPRVRFKVLE